MLIFANLCVAYRICCGTSSWTENVLFELISYKRMFVTICKHKQVYCGT